MILSRVKINPQQRYDLEEFFAQLAAARSDSKLWVQKFLSDQNLIMNGFLVSGIGVNSATVNVANAALIIPENTSDFSYFISAPSDTTVTIPDASLVDDARNYVEAALTAVDGTPLTKAFWDPQANSGLGAEFNQIVNTITDLKVNFVVSTGGFSGLPDRLPICIIDTNPSGVIKVILDRRELYGRLAKPNDLDHNYSWGTKVDPIFTLNMTSVTGTFVAGEVITLGGETATIISGGTSSVTFNEVTGVNFSNGDSVVGGTSGATGTINTVAESFVGVDKSLSDQKNINDAMMTEIKALKGTRFWWQTGPSNTGLKQEVMSTMAPISSGAKVKWNGSNLIITDDSVTPASTDNVAAIRLLNSTKNLYLRRQDDGKEVVTVTLPEVPDIGILTLNQNGHLIAINWDDSASAIQTTWNGSGAFAATVSGSPSSKKIVITANAAGAQVDAIQSSNTFQKSGSSVTPVLTIKQGMASDQSIAISDGQVLYVDLPHPLVDTNYSVVGSGASNYKVTNRGNPVLQDSTYWLAYREGSKLIWRFSGELQSGESTEISDTIPQSILDAIGIASEASMPSYDSNIRGVASESLVKRASVLTDAVGDEQEDRSGYLRSDDKVTWDGSELSFTSDIILEFVNTKNGTLSKHVVPMASSPILLNNLESAYILIDRSLANENCTVFLSDTNAIPAQSQAKKDVFVLFRRQDAASGQFLHVPFHKQLIESGSPVRLGAPGSASAAGNPPLFVQEIPVGTVDGINNTFSLSHVPKTNGGVLVTIDSIKVAESDLSFVSTAMTFSGTSIPQLGQQVEVFYIANTTNSLTGVQEVPSGTVNGINDTFSLSGVPPSSTSVVIFVDGVKTPITGWNLSGSNIVFVAGFIPQLGQSVEAYYVANLDTTTVFQEVPTGAIDGVNDTFTLASSAPYKNAAVVFVNGLKSPLSDWNSISGGSAIKFNAGSIPQLGQSVEVYYFNTVGGGGGGGSSPKVEYRTVTSGEAIAKQLTLLGAPVVAAYTLVDVKGVGAQWYGDDFTVSTNILQWSGLGMDSLPIVAGDKIRILYFV